jgi:Methyltransferase domain
MRPRRGRWDRDDAFVTAPLTESLKRSPPRLHDSPDYWGLAWEALTWLEENVHEGMSTLETGAGASTIVFAARGAEHEVVTPDPEEERRIRAACEERGIDASRVTFHIGPSQEVLPDLAARELDLALVDGAHGFPYPVLDWWNLSSRLKVGGRMLLDDAYLPGVAAIVDYVKANDAWALDQPVSFRTACIRKLRDEEPPGDADALAAHGRMSFSYLPPGRRLVASARTRVFSTRAGIWVIRKLRGPR